MAISVQFDATRIIAEHNPPITLTVNVAPNTPASITNVANVSGGGDSNLANNASSDVIVIADPIVIQPVPTLHEWSLVLPRRITGSQRCGLFFRQLPAVSR